MQQLTANKVLINEIREIRTHSINKEITKRSKRLQKQADKRSWALQELIEARQGLKRARIVERRIRPVKKLILVLPVSFRPELTRPR